jgi:glycosyltransferase involved in cell wall biosynthesis
VFDLESNGRAGRNARPLRLVALGTVEPRKNFVAAARITSALRARGLPNATLDIVGRRGWGDDWGMLEAIPGVTLHGYQTNDRVRQLLDDADIFICTSHDEGLGLPLLEAQYGGLPIVAPDAAVFHEVLGVSGIFVDPADPVAAATRIEAMLSQRQWRSRYVTLAAQNIKRWNALATADHDTVISLIAELSGQQVSATPAYNDHHAGC